MRFPSRGTRGEELERMLSSLNVISGDGTICKCGGFSGRNGKGIRILAL